MLGYRYLNPGFKHIQWQPQLIIPLRLLPINMFVLLIRSNNSMVSAFSINPGSYTAFSRNPRFDQNSFSISSYPSLTGVCHENLVNFTIYEIARNSEGEIVIPPQSS